MPRRYVSNAILRLQLVGGNVPPDNAWPDANKYWARCKLLLDEQSWISPPDPHHRDQSAGATARLREEVSALALGPRGFKAHLIPIASSGETPETAQATTREIVARLNEINIQIARQEPPCPDLSGHYCPYFVFEVLDPATLPDRPTPDPRALATLGATLGLLAAVLHELGRDRRVATTHRT